MIGEFTQNIWDWDVYELWIGWDWDGLGKGILNYDITNRWHSYSSWPSIGAAKALVDFYRVQADDGLGGAFQDVAVVAGTYTTVECGSPVGNHPRFTGKAIYYRWGEIELPSLPEGNSKNHGRFGSFLWRCRGKTTNPTWSFSWGNHDPRMFFFGPRAPGPPEVPDHGPTLSLPGGSRDGGGHRAVHVGLPTGETVGLPTRTIWRRYLYGDIVILSGDVVGIFDGHMIIYIINYKYEYIDMNRSIWSLQL